MSEIVFFEYSLSLPGGQFSRILVVLSTDVGIVFEELKYITCKTSIVLLN